MSNAGAEDAGSSSAYSSTDLQRFAELYQPLAPHLSSASHQMKDTVHLMILFQRVCCWCSTWLMPVRALKELGIKTSVVSNGDPRIGKLFLMNVLSRSQHTRQSRYLSIPNVTTNNLLDGESFQTIA